ncbi:MAG: bifunctional folylpolyglutamate synthase/dihydrofolate synthase [Oscillospiraceae bacterium]|nr:bifunctional folylpolyglutamate synthase/dihydrofolate synthase [Oscillospiraceae bacterium]
MTGAKALEYIYSVSWKGSVPGLSRTQELLRRLGNPEKTLRFVHVAGTNGKGSTAALLDNCLRKAGYRTGLYTSPPLLCFHERMRISGEMITDEELGEITEEIRAQAETMEDKPTEFELITVVALCFFARRKAEIVILETGMGGEMDSTNVIPSPEAAVICNIGFDHTQFLGSTLPEIASAKAGIIKPGTTAVCYEAAEPAVEQVYADRCKAVGAKLRMVDFSALTAHSRTLEGQVFSFGERKELCLSLLGEHQIKNAAVALTVLDALRERGWKIPEAAIREGLATAVWRGRFELLRRDPLFVIDGGHNPQCLDALSKNIDDYLAGIPLTVLMGVLADKDYAAMYAPLLARARHFVTLTPDSPRALDGDIFAEELRALGTEAQFAPDAEQGVAQAVRIAKADGGAVLVCGSLYLLGDVIRAVEKLLPEA